MNLFTYRHDMKDPNSIADNYIRTLYIDSQNTLWVGTGNGLSRYNPATNDFTNYTRDEAASNTLSDNVVWTIYEVRTDNTRSQLAGAHLLIATDTGLHKFNSVNGEFSLISNENGNESFSAVKAIHQDGKGNFWLGTFDDGAYLANQNFTLVKHLKENATTTSQWNFTIDASSIFDIKQVAENYWLATDNGIYIVDKNYQLLHHLNQKSTNYQLLSNQVRSILATKGSELWVGSKEGINAIDLLTLSTVQVAKRGSAPNEFEEPWVMTSFEDNTGNLWFGTYGGGVKVHKISSRLLQSGPHLTDTDDLWLSSFAQDHNGVVWFSNESGELFQQAADGDIAKLANVPLDVAQIHYKDESTLWLKTYGEALYELDINTLALTRHVTWPPSAQSLQELVAIGEAICQINSAGQLSCFTGQTKQSQTFMPEGEQAITLLQYHSADSLLLLTESQSIYRFSIAEQRFELVYSLSETELQSLMVSNMQLERQNLWLAASGKGIIHIDLVTNKVSTFSENNGLNNSYIADMLLSAENNLWFATNKGIGVIDSKTKILKLFDRDYGLHHIEFNTHSALSTLQGWAYFGSPKGYIRFRPQQLFNAKQQLNTPVINDVTIANKSIKTLPAFSELQLPLNLANAKSFSIGYRDFPLSFELSLLTLRWQTKPSIATD